MATDKSPLREGLSGPTPQLSYKLKTLSEDIEESDGDGHCVSSYFDADEDGEYYHAANSRNTKFNNNWQESVSSKSKFGSLFPL